MQDTLRTTAPGLVLCILISIPCWFLGQAFPIIGGPVFGILAGMIITLLMPPKESMAPGIKFASKKILQWAVILLGFGLNLGVVLKTGAQSLPIILSTIATSLIIAFFGRKPLKIDDKTATLVGVGSSICGGSAIAATAPVIDATDEEVAQSISVIFFFNMLAALIFPALGTALGFSTKTGEAFGIFAGTAVNDTSSVTAAAATWDSMYGLGSATLDKAVTVKLTRTLAIIPITLALAFRRARGEEAVAESAAKKNGEAATAAKRPSLRKSMPTFILFFILASIITTVAGAAGIPAEVFAPFKTASKFFIVIAMSAIGLHTNVVKLVKSGARPLLLGFCCWVGITAVTLCMQHFLGIW